jgi:hypothetical protein
LQFDARLESFGKIFIFVISGSFSLNALSVKNLDYKRKVTVTATVLIVATVLVASFAIIQTQRGPDLAAYTAQAQVIFNAAKAVVEEVRNCTLPDVTLHVITKQQAVDMWGHPSGTQDLTNIYRQENIYKNLFLMPENDSLVQANADWTANWGAATAGNDVYVIKENFDPFNMPSAEATFVHELTHVWQHRTNIPAAVTFDQDRAHTALVEGDASFMGDYYINLTKAQPTLRNAKVYDVSVVLLGLPSTKRVYPMANTLWELDYFPYDQGKAFVETLYQHGGFGAIYNAYDFGYVLDTTADILHPDEYFANKSAQQTNAAVPLTGNWTLAKTSYNENYNTYGEFFIQVMLSNWLSGTNAQEAENAAAGWTGDNFTYLENNKDYLFTWNITWASVTNASEFCAAFNEMMALTGAQTYGPSEWTAYQRFLSLNWNQTSTSTLIACSTLRVAVQISSIS